MPSKGGKKTEPLEFAATPKLMKFLQELVRMEGYGNSKAEVARNFVWKEVNRLREIGKLQD